MKQCLLCSTVVYSQHRLCYSCYREYKDSMKEEWFIALVDLQKVQDKIDMKERYTVDTRQTVDMYGTYNNTGSNKKRRVGRPGAQLHIIQEVLFLFDRSIELERYYGGRRLSLRGIERLMNKRIRYLAVRRILRRYRKDTFANTVS